MTDIIDELIASSMLSKRGKCLWCGEGFIKPNSAVNTKKFCSQNCRKSHAQSMKARANPSYYKEQHRKRYGELNILHKNCSVCQTYFQTSYKHGVTCSRECALVHRQLSRKRRGVYRKAQIDALFEMFPELKGMQL